MVMEKEVSFLSVLLVLAAIVLAGYLSHGSVQGAQVYGSRQLEQPLSAPSSGGTPLDNAIQFLKDFGFFSVVLPFLLIFAIMFGILEKTKIFGVEKIKGDEVPKRNLNSIVAFVVALLFVAAGNLVKVIQVALPQVILVLVIIIFFLMVMGSLMKTEEMNIWEKAGKWNKFFMVAIMIAVLAIFLNAFGVLGPILGYTFSNATGTFITSLIFFAVVIIAIVFMTRGGGSGKKP